jgi:hypothetical protein
MTYSYDIGDNRVTFTCFNAISHQPLLPPFVPSPLFLSVLQKMNQQQQQRITQLQEENAQLQASLQQSNQHNQQLQESLQQSNQHNQQLQQQNQQLQQQQEEPESDDDDEEEDDPLAMNEEMDEACHEGDIDTIIMLLDSGVNIDCVDAVGNSPIMIALGSYHLDTAIELAQRGANLSIINERGSNLLHCAAWGGADYVVWVLANTTIDVNSTDDDNGFAPIMLAMICDNLEAAKLLVEKGANLFIESNAGQRPIDHRLGPQVLQHAKDLRFASIKNLLILSKSCSSSSKSILPSVVSVFSNSDLVRNISTFMMRKDVIVKDTTISEEEQEPDEVRRRVEASLASSSSSNKRART